jgi:4-hydroxybenzoate polyprenyltransferase
LKIGDLLQSVRPTQWTKNLFVFAALIFAQKIFDGPLLLRACAAFVVFCLFSGSVYLINDVLDYEEDRNHPKKSRRPIAAGRVGRRTAVVFAILLAAVSLAGAFFLSSGFFIVGAVYLVLQISYSIKLKHVVILDVFIVASGFVLRVVAGGLVIHVQLSSWLLICTTLLALFIAMSKRRHELVLLEEGAPNHRPILKEYSAYLLDQMISVVTASCVTAYAFYTTARETVDKFHTHRLTWTIPFVLYGIFRYLYLVHRKEQGGSPTDILLTDRPLLATVALWGLAIVLIVYTAPGGPFGHPGEVGP